MASKMLILVIALAMMTTALVAADEDLEALLQDLMPMAKRGKGRKKGKGRGGAFLAANLFSCEDMSGYGGCVCDRSAINPEEPVICS